MSGRIGRCIACFIFLAFIVLVLCFTFINLFCDEGGQLLPVSEMVNFSANYERPLILIKNRFYFIDFILDENNNLVRLERIGRYTHYWFIFLSVICNIKIMQYMCIAILMSILYILANKINKRVPVVALFIGGHHPPKIKLNSSTS